MRICIQERIKSMGDRRPDFSRFLSQVAVISIEDELRAGSSWRKILESADIILIHESDRHIDGQDCYRKAIDLTRVDCLIICYSDATGWSLFKERTENNHTVWMCSHHCIQHGASELIKRKMDESSRGIWDPTALGYDPFAAVTGAIHDLYSIPVRLDAETATEIAKMSANKASEYVQDCVAMWQATFAGKKDPSDANNVEPEVIRAVRQIGDRQDAALCTVDDYLTGDSMGFSLTVTCSQWGAFGKLVKEAYRCFALKAGGLT
jgi:hypothetical protein